MPTDADGHIAHQFHAAQLGVVAQCQPLAETQPLDEGEKPKPSLDGSGIALAEFLQK